MLTLQAFRDKYPEFATGPDSLLQLWLDDAAGRIDPEVWGIHTDRGHGLLTAHLICLSPNGQFARLQSDKGQTTYGAEYDKLRDSVACGIRVF